MKKIKEIILLGASGSIGQSALKLLRMKRERFKLIGVSVNNNVKNLNNVVDEFDVKYVSIIDQSVAKEFNSKAKLLVGEKGLEELTSIKCDIVVSGISGIAGLVPSLNALRSGSNLAIANKEPLVIAGEMFLKESEKNNVRLLPTDSEHNSIFQLFNEEHRDQISHITLTASGGPFLNHEIADFQNISPEQALKHPIWKMGKKISIDSATLINKALEIIEAGVLFGLKSNQVDVLVHPESIIHGLVHYKDGSVLANLGLPDMITPLSVALSFPERFDLNMKKLNLEEISQLTFQKPDIIKFPGLKLGWELLESEIPNRIVMNSANELAVESFLDHRIKFDKIVDVIYFSLDRLNYSNPKNLEDILDIDRRSRINILENMTRFY